MKFLVFVKATPNSEQGIFPPDAEKLFAEMGKFNEKLVTAGVMKDGDGLKPSRAGKRIQFSDDGRTQVIDGPFAETKELVAGYWIWEAKSLEEAVEWAKQCPNPMPGEDGVLEIRPVYAAEDFADMVPPEALERDSRLRREITQRRKVKAKAKTTTKVKAKSKAKAKAKAGKPSPARRRPAPKAKK